MSMPRNAIGQANALSSRPCLQVTATRFVLNHQIAAPLPVGIGDGFATLVQEAILRQRGGPNCTRGSKRRHDIMCAQCSFEITRPPGCFLRGALGGEGPAADPGCSSTHTPSVFVGFLRISSKTLLSTICCVCLSERLHPRRNVRKRPPEQEP